LFYAGIFPFRTFAIDLFTSKLLSATGSYAASGMAFAWAQQRAGNLNSVLPLSAMVATPLFGLLSDKIRKRATLMMLGSLLMLPVYLMIGYTHISLLFPTAMMGVACSLVPAVMWPSVAYIVDERRMGTAYALMGLMQQVGFAIFNYTVGRANDFAAAGPSNPRGFLPGLWIFSILGFLGLLFAYLLRRRELGPEGHGLETIMATSGS
jgi:sugar phosphate permease